MTDMEKIILCIAGALGFSVCALAYLIVITTVEVVL